MKFRPTAPSRSSTRAASSASRVRASRSDQRDHVKVTSDSQKKIYFVQGHGEHDTGSADEQRGYSIINDALGEENFSIAKLVLVQNPAVPDDGGGDRRGPQSDYLAPEIDALKAYLNKGGKVLFMLDPPARSTLHR